jgi:diaminopimelate epimerase
MQNTLNFIKMEGIGNDFIVSHEIGPELINRLVEAKNFSPLLINLCDRRKGVGGDGVILILPASSNSADFKMRIFNSDGSEAEMCGNGIRCCAQYVRILQLSNKQSLTFETGAGRCSTSFIDNGLIRVAMSTPIFDAPLIPTQQTVGKVIMHDLEVAGKTFKINALSMGNPHTVIFTDHITDELVQTWGKRLETHRFFPKKTNVEFVKVLSKNELEMRVWERGCGVTQACGTGACAAVVAGIINNLLEKKATAHLPGGDLFIEWDGSEKDPVYLTGPAKAVFKGTTAIDL